MRHTRTLFGTLAGASFFAAIAAGSLALAATGSAAAPVSRPQDQQVRQEQRVRVIVRLDGPAAEQSATRGIEWVRGRVVATQPALRMLVGEVPASAVPGLRAVPGVVGVTPDSLLPTLSLGYDPAGQPGSMTNVTRVTGANAAWQKGFTGDGVDVAVIDTGVAPVPALSAASKVVVGPDLSFESQSSNLRHLDTYGHGTHMAGIIAGRETPKGTGAGYAADRTNFYGMAPDARLVSLKLADHDGAVDVSQVIAAINWVVAHRYDGGANIRVLNLSFGTQSPQSAALDPLSWAAEVAWHAGIVVVASAGNDSGKYAGLANPAYNPFVIAVGAADTRSTDSRSDDIVPSFSARQDGTARGVDLVAPGVGIVSSGVPGSKLFESYPAARVGNGLLRGSGTSQAAAVVSGAAAVLLSKYPWLNPDQVKGLLVRNADRLPGQDVAAQGAGELDLAGAVDDPAPWNVPMQSMAWGSGTGSLEKARGSFHVVADGVALSGEQDIMGSGWNPLLTSGGAWGGNWGVLWNLFTLRLDATFNGAVWIGDGYAADTTSWAGRTWSGRTWSGRTWSGRTWSGRTWSGRTWSGSTWSGTGWSSASWPSPVSTPSWAGALWSTSAWG